MTASRIVILTVLFIVVGAAVLRGFGASGDNNPIASVDNGAPRGLLALELFLVERGIHVDVRRTDADPAPAAGALVVVPPPEAGSMTADEAQALLAHADGGGTVLVLCDDDEEPRSKRLNALLGPAGIVCFQADVALGDVAETVAVSVVPGIARQLRVSGLGRARAGAHQPVVPLMRVGADLVALSRARGAGRVVVIGSATPFTNDGLAERDNAAFLLDLVGDRPVQIDQRLHHARVGNMVALAGTRGIGPITLLIGVLLLVPLSLLSLSPRRGDLPARADDDGAPAAASQVSALAALLALARRD